jgi:hypothetical protein
MALRIHGKNFFKDNLYLFIPSLIWLSLTLRFTFKANIYADDAALISDFEDGGLGSHLNSFLNWVPGRNLTIFFQFLFFRVSSTNIESFGFYHGIAQLFYVCTAITIGVFIFKSTKNKFLALIATTLFLFNPLHVEITNWALALPQHIISTLASLITIYFLFQPSRTRNTIFIYFGIIIMVFTYDQSAALALFIIIYTLLPLNNKLMIINFRRSKSFIYFSALLTICFFCISYFGRKSLGHGSNLSGNSLGLLYQNLFSRPIHLFTKFANYYMEEPPIAVVLSSSGALLLAISVLIFQRHKISFRLKNINFFPIKVSIFFLFSSFFSFLPVALWYPAIRHLYLPGALLLISVFIFLDALNFLKTWRQNFIQNLILVLALLLFAFLQTSSLVHWQNRDAVRKNFYLELSEKSKEFPAQTYFFIDGSSSELNKLFYAELMTSAYQYYNNVSNFEQVKISQMSKAESLKICLATQVQQSVFVQITLDTSNHNAFEYNVVPEERFCN